MKVEGKWTLLPPNEGDSGSEGGSRVDPFHPFPYKMKVMLEIKVQVEWTPTPLFTKMKWMVDVPV